MPGAPVAWQRRLPHPRCHGDSSRRPARGRGPGHGSPSLGALRPRAGTGERGPWVLVAWQPRPRGCPGRPPLSPSAGAPSPGRAPSSASHSFSTTGCSLALEKKKNEKNFFAKSRDGEFRQRSRSSLWTCFVLLPHMPYVGRSGFLQRCLRELRACVHAQAHACAWPESSHGQGTVLSGK